MRGSAVCPGTVSSAPAPLPRASLSGFRRHWATPAYVLDPAWTDGPRELTPEEVQASRDQLDKDLEAGALWSIYNPIGDYGLASPPVEQRTLYWWCWRARVHSMLQWTVHAADVKREEGRDWDSRWVDVARLRRDSVHVAAAVAQVDARFTRWAAGWV